MKKVGIDKHESPEKGDGVQCTHGYSKAVVATAKKEVMAFFRGGKVRKPGDLEDKFTGQWSLFLEYWRMTPHYPALGELVNEGKIVFGTMPDGDVVYAMPGKLPKGAK